jgi:hypothetical protein
MNIRTWSTPLAILLYVFAFCASGTAFIDYAELYFNAYMKHSTPGIFARENASSPFMMTCGILQKMLRTHI